jgi:hypothetical protein
MAKKMVTIGKELIQDVLKEIPLSKGEIGDIIGLGQGGFWRVTHVSGRMNEIQWENLKKLYFEKTGKRELPSTDPLIESDVLKTYSIESLVDEIENRGWTVSISRRQDRT